MNKTTQKQASAAEATDSSAQPLSREDKVILAVIALFVATVLCIVGWDYFVDMPEDARAKAIQVERNKRWRVAADAASLQPSLSVQREAALDTLAQSAAQALPAVGVYQYKLDYALSDKADDAGTLRYDLLLRSDNTFVLEYRDSDTRGPRSLFTRGGYKFVGQTLLLSHPSSSTSHSGQLNYGDTRFAVTEATSSSFSIQNDSKTPLRFVWSRAPIIAAPE
jgi:hypothetical protein